MVRDNNIIIYTVYGPERENNSGSAFGPPTTAVHDAEACSRQPLPPPLSPPSGELSALSVSTTVFRRYGRPSTVLRYKCARASSIIRRDRVFSSSSLSLTITICSFGFLFFFFFLQFFSFTIFYLKTLHVSSRRE